MKGANATRQRTAGAPEHHDGRERRQTVRIPPGFDELQVDQQIEMVQALWDRIAEHPERVPVPPWHLEILQDRLEEHRKNPGEGSPWAEVRQRIEQRLREQAEQAE